MSEVLHPVVLYLLIAAGAVGVWTALPRRRVNPQGLGILIAGVALGGLMLALALKAGSDRPAILFYVFAGIAVLSALRVITHQRPVYAALYFILTILSSAGMYILLHAEFMAFALVIIYAGAILITYLFVIMLATQAPSEEELDSLADYDAQANSPFIATLAGFVLLGVLSGLMARGIDQMPDAKTRAHMADWMTDLAASPGKIEGFLLEAGLLEDGERVVRSGVGMAIIDEAHGTVQVAGYRESGELIEGTRRVVGLPENASLSNVESLAFDFLNRHPGAIEIAGVILLMAMLGATVLSRRQVEMEEDRKRDQSLRTLGDRVEGDA